jgi:hypothetical protein
MKTSQIIIAVVSSGTMVLLSKAFYIAGKGLWKQYKSNKEAIKLSKDFEISVWQKSFSNVVNKKNWLED